MRSSNTKTPPGTETRYVFWGISVFLLVVIALIYGQTLNFPLLDYDDNGFVYENSHVTAGLTVDGIRWAFVEGPFGEWYPLDPLSHMLDCQLFGLNAWGHHLTNVLLHAAASIALFLVLRGMTKQLWPSAFVAAVFALHPQHVESVAWVSERRDVLSGLFFVLTLGAWLGYVGHGRSPRYYLLTAAMFTLALMSKPMVVTLPPLLLLLDFWPLARFGAAQDTPGWTRSIERPSPGRLILEKLPLVALAVGDCLITLSTHGKTSPPLPWPERIGNAAVSCVTYVMQFCFPVDLAAFYPNPVGGPPVAKVAGAVAILIAASAAAVIWRRRYPYCFVGWFWFLGMLTPVLGLVKVADHTMADRYMYLPSIGLSIAVAWCGTRFAAGSPARGWALGACAALVLIALTACAQWQTSLWADEETLWRHALSCTIDNGEAELGLADALTRKGQRAEAIAHYRRAQQFATDSGPYNNLGSLLAQEGRLGEAIAEFRRALELYPDWPLTHANLGRALATQGHFDEAMECFDRALKINPLDVSTRCDRAHLLRLQGKADEARAELERAVQLDPRGVTAHNDLATMLLQEGRFDLAKPHLEAALAVDPRFVPALLNLAVALAERGQADEAIALYRRILAIAPNHPQARASLDNLSHTRPAPQAP